MRLLLGILRRLGIFLRRIKVRFCFFLHLKFVLYMLDVYFFFGLLWYGFKCKFVFFVFFVFCVVFCVVFSGFSIVMY